MSRIDVSFLPQSLLNPKFDRQGTSTLIWNDLPACMHAHALPLARARLRIKTDNAKYVRKQDPSNTLNIGICNFLLPRCD